MPRLAWNEALTLGHTEIDSQHAMLVELINELHDQIQDGRKRQGLLDAVQGLKAYADYHFSEEERLMLRQGYPELEDHRLMHLEFHEKVDTCAATIDHLDPETTAGDILAYLTGWLARHIQRDDRDFVRFLSGR